MNSSARIGVVGRVHRAALSDEALLHRAQHGDPACFDELYRRYSPAIFGYCLVRLSDRLAAEDSTQEVFLKLHNSSGESVGNARAWLFTVARNVVIDAARRRRATPVHVELEAAVDRATAVVDESEFSAMDVATNVFIALRRLPARQRRAMILRDFQDRSSQEIADELEMRAGSVDVLMCRARAAFGRAYAEVSEMPLTCRQTTEAIYREMGSGVSQAQRAFVDAHMASCPRCRAEYSRARSPRVLGGMLPWLWLRVDAMGLTDVLNRLRAASAAVSASVGQLPHADLPVTAKATLGIAVTAAILVPGVAVKMADTPTPEPKTFRSVLADQGSRSATIQMSEDKPGERASSGASGTWHDATSANGFEHLDMKTRPKAMDEGHGSWTSDPEHSDGSSMRSDASDHASTSTHTTWTNTDTANETHSGAAADSYDGVEQSHE